MQWKIRGSIKTIQSDIVLGDATQGQTDQIK